MAKPRSGGQRLINFPADEAFIRELDAALAKTNYADRSKFIRDAIYEKLEKHGILLPESLRKAPARMGKGGRPRKETSEVYNSNSAQVDAAIKLSRKGEALVAPASDAGSQRSPGVAAPNADKGEPSPTASRHSKAPPRPPKPVPTSLDK
jgi:Arc/MetJ-type ribon-helix-helix transcriptional regulator